MKLKACSDFLKGRCSIGELDDLPNRISHTFYYKNYKRQLYLQNHPKEAEAEATSEAFGSLGGML